MTIQAKYRGICHTCGGQISIGDTIEWARGQGARHLDCAGASPRPRRSGPRRRRPAAPNKAEAPTPDALDAILAAQGRQWADDTIRWRERVHGAVAIGEIVQRHGRARPGVYMVVEIKASYYVDDDFREAQDRDDLATGWYTPYALREVTRTAKERAVEDALAVIQEASALGVRDPADASAPKTETGGWTELRATEASRSSAAMFDRGRIWLDPPRRRVIYYHGGSYDDYRGTVRRIDEPEFGTRVAAAIDALVAHWGSRSTHARERNTLTLAVQGGNHE